MTGIVNFTTLSVYMPLSLHAHVLEAWIRLGKMVVCITSIIFIIDFAILPFPSCQLGKGTSAQAPSLSQANKYEQRVTIPDKGKEKKVGNI